MEDINPSGNEISLSGSRIYTLGQTTDCIFAVEKGEVDIFLTFGEDAAGQRHHLMTVKEGAWIFDNGFGRPGAGLTVLAAGQPGTLIRRLRELPHSAQGIAERLDEWIESLTSGISRFVAQNREFTREIIPGTLAPGNPDEILGVRQGVFWWERKDAKAILFGLEPVDVPWLPIAREGWVLLNAQTTESFILDTGSFLEMPDWRNTLSEVHQYLTRVTGKAMSGQEAGMRLAVATRLRLSNAAEEGGWRDIAEVLDPAGPGGGLGNSGPGGTSVQAAFQRVAANLGVTTTAHATDTEGQAEMDIVAALSRSAVVRWRQIVLSEFWFTRDAGPLICFSGRTKEAVAMLPSGPRSYNVVASDGTRLPVTKENAGEFQPFAIVLYRPLPPGKLGLRDVLKFAARGNARDLVMIALMIAATGVLGLATPALTARIYDVIIPQAERGLMAQIAIILISSTILSSLFDLVRSVALLRVQNRTDSDLQSAVWDRILRLPMGFFRKFTAGDLANRAQGISEAHQLLSSAGATVFFALPTALFNFIIMFYYSLPLALCGLVIALFGVTLSVVFSIAEVVILRKQYEIRGRLSGMVFQLISGVAKFRLANAESFAFGAWAREYAAQERLSVKAGKWRVASETFFSGFSLLTTAILFALVAWQMGKADSGGPPAFTTGGFLAFNTAFGALIAALVTVGHSSLNLLQLIPTLERTKPIFEAEPEISTDRARPGELRGEIELAKIRFGYGPDSPPVLAGFSLKVNPAEMVALVGPSGCGKSTIFRLLLGFETPDAGSIFYDGKDMATLDLRELRRQIGVVLQATSLVTGNIHRNIVGESSLTLEDAWDAAAMAGLADDIRAMPMQMHTMISEGGGGFSGGQKQRLAIARAFAQRPRMLLFDEATSALDNRTQAIVTESLERLRITRLIIAHRLSTIAKADRIIVLREGAVCEDGTYDELMAREGFFHQLAKRQLA